MREVTRWSGRETRALRQAMRLSVQAFAEHLDLAPRTVAYWESSNKATTPRPFQQSMLDTLLARLEDRARNRFAALLATADSATPGPDVEAELSDDDFGSDGPPTVVSASTIRQLHDAAEIFTRWDHRRGALAVTYVANTQMRWARSVLALPCAAPLRGELYGAVARVGVVAGFVNFDAHCHDLAAKILRFANRCSDEAGDPHLQAKVLSHQARHAIYCGAWVDPLPPLDRALSLPGLSATEQAMLHTGRARAYAKEGRASEAMAAVHAADAAFERSDPSVDPPWMHYYDAAQHLGDTAHAVFDLALAGSHEHEAIDRLRSAVAMHTDEYARSREMSRVKLASLLMVAGDPQEAAAVARATLPELSQIGSARMTALLRELLALSAAHRHNDEVDSLRAQVKEAIAS